MTPSGSRFVTSARTARWFTVGNRVLGCYGLAVIIVLYTPLTDWLARPLHLPPSPAAPADAIVVLEAWAFEDGELNESGLKRALRGAELYRQGIAMRVVVTGRRPTAERMESALRAMAQLIRVAGVPEEALFLEDLSRNTHESAQNVARLSRRHGWKRIVLVTDASHMRRAAGAFRKEGLDVAVAPTLQWGIWGAQPALRFKRVALVSHEYAGLLYYWWRGWL